MATSPRHPRVSVVVPNYNHAEFLGPRLASVFGQTFDDFEVLYLDDASTDGSNKIAESFAGDSRLSIQLNEENSGSPFAQWNKGVAMARGEYVWIAESDDLAEPNLLERLVAALDAEPQAGLAYCKSQPIDTAGKKIPSDLSWTDEAEARHWETDFVNDGRNEISRFLVIRCTIPNASAVLFRRQIFADIGGAPLDYRYAGDWVTWLKFLLQSKICYVHEVCNYHRKHKATVTSGAALDGVWAEEGYRVLNFLTAAMPIPESQLERVRDRLMVKWMASWIHPQCGIDDGRQDAIARQAALADPQLFRRSVRNIMRNGFLRRCRLAWYLAWRKDLGQSDDDTKHKGDQAS